MNLIFVDFVLYAKRLISINMHWQHRSKFTSDVETSIKYKQVTGSYSWIAEWLPGKYQLLSKNTKRSEHRKKSSLQKSFY